MDRIYAWTVATWVSGVCLGISTEEGALLAVLASWFMSGLCLWVVCNHGNKRP